MQVMETQTAVTSLPTILGVENTKLATSSNSYKFHQSIYNRIIINLRLISLFRLIHNIITIPNRRVFMLDCQFIRLYLPMLQTSKTKSIIIQFIVLYKIFSLIYTNKPKLNTLARPLSLWYLNNLFTTIKLLLYKGKKN